LSNKLEEGIRSPLFFVFINRCMLILQRKELILVGVIYYIPDYTRLLNEFYCQFEDTIPDIPRVHKFLNYWKSNIDAKIKEVQVSVSGSNELIKADFYKVIN
jgi:uncharacterized protein Usg